MTIRILAITARHPPYHFGGYELRCKDILDGLSKRGHIILVLTSKKENKRINGDMSQPYYPVLRSLHLRGLGNSVIDRITRSTHGHSIGLALTFLRELALDLWDIRLVDRQIQEFRPDVLYLGHITTLSRSLLPYLATLKIPLVYDEGGSGLIDCWKEKNIWYLFVERDYSHSALLNALKFFVVWCVGLVSSHRLKSDWTWPENLQVFFNGHLNRNNALASGVPVSSMEIIHSGINKEVFAFKPRQALSQTLKILLPGRIEPRKGQVDGIGLLASLRENGINAALMIVGERWDEDYYSRVLGKIENLNLEPYVTIFPMKSHTELIDLYHQADICFFPSYHQSGFSRIVLESMATGCIYISYGNEGSDEVVRHRQNGFLVRSQDFQTITGFIKKMFLQPDIVREIANAGRSDIEAGFSMEKYIEKIEQVIQTSVKCA